MKIIKKIWTEEKPTFEGKYYSIAEAINSPKPVQKPHPPILIGGRGRKLTLRIVAELADQCNFGGSLEPEGYVEILDVLNRHYAKVDRSPDEIEKTHIVYDAIIARSERDLKQKIKRFKPKNVSAHKFIKGNLIGTPEQIVEKIYKFIDVGVTYFMLRFLDMMALEPLMMFAEQVIPTFK